MFKNTTTVLLISLTLVSNFSLATAKFGYSEDELRQLQNAEQNVTPLSENYETSINNTIDKSYDFQKKALELSQEWNKKLTTNSLDPILDVNPQENPSAQASGILVFTSLSMPRPSLLAMLKQSEALNVPLILRGVLPEGFPATTKTIESLLNTEQPPINSGFAINPEWFKQFDIKEVPAFAVVKEGRCLPKQPCGQDDFDIVYGNISIYRALEILSTGDNANIIRSHLAKVGVAL